MFSNRSLVIATKHGKERVISPLLKEQLGVLPFTTDLVDTDALGTFTGEIERVLSPIEAARQKCVLALEKTGCDLAIASEGSFGAHPIYGFIPANEEILLFADLKNNIEIIQTHLNSRTNFNSRVISTLVELLEFANQVKFPSHALILKKMLSDQKPYFIKGIKEQKQLIEAFESLRDDSVEIIAETDMRAMNNPTRMSVIAECAEKLVRRVKSTCPKCNFPGFGVTSSESGLPCERCSLPTRSILKTISTCKKCSFTHYETCPHGKMREEPTFCDFCNP